MATFTQIEKAWQARIRKAGFPNISKNFPTKKAATDWATKTEAEMIALKHQDVRVVAKMTISDLIDRYIKEVGGDEGFGKNKTAVLNTLKRDLGSVLIPHFTVDRLTAYIKQRKMEGAGGVTIAIDLSYIKTVLITARQLFRLPVNVDIVTDARANMKYFKLSTKSIERNRRPTDDEITRICDFFSAKGSRQKLPMPALIQFAMATAMRSGEITRIRWDDLDLEHKTILIRDRKDPRAKIGNNQVVPLLADALKIALDQPRNSDRIFPYSEKTISSIFPRALNELKIEDLHFHDLRHEGTSRLFEDGYRIEEVAIFTGHKDWKQLKRYTHIKAKNLHKDRHGNDRRIIEIPPEK